MLNNINQLGEIFGVEEKAAEEVAKVEAKIAEVKTMVEEKDLRLLLYG